jgi:hypothetical protein
MVEFTPYSTGLSTSTIPDSVFQIPADYKKIRKRLFSLWHVFRKPFDGFMLVSIQPGAC